ncbi:MAG: hypothetical protein EOM78_19150 [Erysipelotrichia bacterium]|nr:hypothetical protein [Erysipelotrichia bacterium]
MFAIHHILFIKINQIIKNNINPIIVGNISHQNLSHELSFISIFVQISGFLSHKSFKESVCGKITISLLIFSTQFSTTFAQDSVAIALFQSIKISVYAHELNFFSSKLSQISVSLYT